MADLNFRYIFQQTFVFLLALIALSFFFDVAFLAIKGDEFQTLFNIWLEKLLTLRKLGVYFIISLGWSVYKAYKKQPK